MSRQRVELETEVEFDVSELFYSTTDERGIVSSGNDVFIRISEYSKDEIMGKPHSLIRHSDMPRAVFRLFWTVIKSGKSIVAYVKNRAKSGRYYWVLAFVQPIDGGYLSIRIKPTSELFGKIPDLYHELLRAEQVGGMDKADELLASKLAELGFESYEAFMIHALSEELKAADKILAGREKERRQGAGGTGSSQGRAVTSTSKNEFVDCLRVFEELARVNQGIFSNVDHFIEAGPLLEERFQAVEELKKNLKFTSFNTAIQSHRIGSSGATLSVVADLIHKTSSETSEQVAVIQEASSSLIAYARDVTFNIGAAKIQIEMSRRFITELCSAAQGANVTEEELRQLKANCEVLVIALRKSFLNVTERLQNFSERMDVLLGQIQRLEQQVMTLEIAKKSGMIESSRIGKDGHVFSGILSFVETLVNQERRQLTSFSQALRSVSSLAKDSREVGSQLVRLIEKVDYHRAA